MPGAYHTTSIKHFSHINCLYPLSNLVKYVVIILSFYILEN